MFVPVGIYSAHFTANLNVRLMMLLSDQTRF